MVVLFIILASRGPLPCSAQQRLELAPHLGFYLPVGTLVDEADPGAVRRRHLWAGMVGTTVDWWLGSRVAVGASLGYSPSMVAVTDSLTTTDVRAGVLFSSLRGVLALSRPSAAWKFHLAPGIGVIQRGGAAWNGVRGTADVAFVLAAGARHKVSRAIRASLELTYFGSRARFNDGLASQTRSRLRHDVLWALGVAFPITGGSSCAK